MLRSVLPSCRAAAEASRFVAIDQGALRDFATRLAGQLPTGMVHTPHHFSGDAEATLAYFMVLDALNFGSGFFTHLAPYRGEDGYYAVATGLRDWFAGSGVPSLAKLRTIEPAAVAAVLGQDLHNRGILPFIELCASALRDLGRFVEDDLHGDWMNLLRQADHTADGVVGLLARMPFFHDISDLDGQPVYLLKRAQIFVQDLAIAASGRGWFEIEGLERLTVFADNFVPAILAANGVLAYDPDLSKLIGEHAPLRQGSRAEVEVRANAVHACELLRLEFKDRGVTTSAREIDYALWNGADALQARGEAVPHICHTYFY